MDKLVSAGHSIGDWDFESILSLELNSIFYISAPTSLACRAIDHDWQKSWLFLKPALGKCIPYGRSITWESKHSRDTNPTFWFFRTQALPINDYPEDTYEFFHGNTTWNLNKRVGGVLSPIAGDDLPDNIPNHLWCHLRLTWYEVFDSDLSSLLRVIFDYEIDGVWVQQFFYDIADPLWSDSEDNRVGFKIWGHEDDQPCRIDDTEIWRKTT